MLCLHILRAYWAAGASSTESNERTNSWGVAFPDFNHKAKHSLKQSEASLLALEIAFRSGSSSSNDRPRSNHFVLLKLASFKTSLMNCKSFIPKKKNNQISLKISAIALEFENTPRPILDSQYLPNWILPWAIIPKKVRTAATPFPASNDNSHTHSKFKILMERPPQIFIGTKLIFLMTQKFLGLLMYCSRSACSNGALGIKTKNSNSWSKTW